MTDSIVENKTRPAEYYRAYRRKKKQEKVLNLRRLPTSVRNGGFQEISNEHSALEYLKAIAIGILVVVLTAYLVHISAPTYGPGGWVPYFTAAMVEGILLALVAIKPWTVFHHMFKSTLVVLFSLYTLAPMVVQPLLAAQKSDLGHSQIEKTIESIESEIQERKELRNKVELLRPSFAQKQTLKILALESELRNATGELQRLHSVAQPSSNIVIAGVLVAQRILFLFANLFLCSAFAQQLLKLKKL